METPDNKLRLAGTFLIGFLILSFIFTAVMHFTVGKKRCELAKSFEATGSVGPEGLTDTARACPSILERWHDNLTSSPFYSFYHWFVSLVGGLLASVIYAVRVNK